MKLLKAILFPAFLAITGTQVLAQDIFISGKGVDEQTGTGLPGIYVVNKRSGTGSFADDKGNFSITVHKEDTILVASPGYQSRKLCFRDSSERSVHKILLVMNKLMLNLSEVSIVARRELGEIESDISHLKKYQKSDYMVSGVQSVKSPITFLYQSFSRKEKNKRLVAEMRLEDEKNELLKELLFRYSVTNVIPIIPDEYDDFLLFCNIPYEFFRSASQYQLIIYFKDKYKAFKSK